MTVYQLLREIVQATETDPEVRIAELERQMAAFDAEIARLRDGRLDPYSPTQVKERFLQAEEGARLLLLRELAAFEERNIGSQPR